MKIVIDVDDLDEALGFLQTDRVVGVLEEAGVMHNEECTQYRKMSMAAYTVGSSQFCICTPEGLPLPVYRLVWP